MSVCSSDDLAALEREASRVGATYTALRNVFRDLALQQVHAIDKLSSTLADLDRDQSLSGHGANRTGADHSLTLDGELSMRDVQSLGIAAEFSKDDLEDIISTTLHINSGRGAGSGAAPNRSRTAAYARRLFAELEQALAKDLSQTPHLTAVRDLMCKLLDERVRMELLVLQAASSKRGDETQDTEDEASRQGRSMQQAARRSNAAASVAASASAAATYTSRARELEEQLRRGEWARSGAQPAGARPSAAALPSSAAAPRNDRSRSPPPAAARAGSGYPRSRPVDDFKHDRTDSSASISSIDSR